MNFMIFSVPVYALIFYAPRLPADLLKRSECIRSFVCSLRALQAPCLGTTLGGPPPQEPHPPRDPPTPQGPPSTHPPHPTSPHPTPPPASPRGRLSQVDGYSKWMVIPSAWLSQWVKIRLEQTRTCSDSVNAASIDCFGGSLYLLSSNNVALLVRITRSSQEHSKSTKTTRRPTNT